MESSTEYPQQALTYYNKDEDQFGALIYIIAVIGENAIIEKMLCSN